MISDHHMPSSLNILLRFRFSWERGKERSLRKSEKQASEWHAHRGKLREGSEVKRSVRQHSAVGQREHLQAADTWTDSATGPLIRERLAICTIVERTAEEISVHLKASQTLKN